MKNVWFKKRYAVAALLIGCFVFLQKQAVPPVILYHHIDDRSAERKLSVSTESFARQMEFLKAHKYHVIKLSEYIRLLKESKRIPNKTIVITFDDGYEDHFRNAFPILKTMGFPATLFVQTDRIGLEGYMTLDDLKILLNHGIEIGSHSMHHGYLPGLDDEAMSREIKQSKPLLERWLRRPITLFCYPDGGFDARARQMVIQAGYEGAVATHPGKEYPDQDPYALKRIRISRTADHLIVFWLKVSGFYTWIEELRG